MLHLPSEREFGWLYFGSLPGLINGYVYLIFDPSAKLYKIGRTNHLRKRMANLKRKTRSALKLIAKIKTADTQGLEAYLHKKYHHARDHGEWFRLHPYDVEEIADMQSNFFYIDGVFHYEGDIEWWMEGHCFAPLPRFSQPMF